MIRTFRVEGFVILTDRMGEIHKQVRLFTKERGIIHTVAHGALKPTGKLKAVTELFVHGRYYLYQDPVKENWKITDAECLDDYSHIRQSLVRFYAASLFVEIILKSHGGGEAVRSLFDLCHVMFPLLDRTPENEVTYLVFQYILRFLDMTGMALSGEECALCQKKIPDSESSWMMRRTSGFVCGDCLREPLAELSPGAKAYYARSRILPLVEACRLRLSTRALTSFRTMLFVKIQETLERELNTLATAKGVW